MYPSVAEKFTENSISILFLVFRRLKENSHFTAGIAVKFGFGLLTITVPPSRVIVTIWISFGIKERIFI